MVMDSGHKKLHHNFGLVCPFNQANDTNKNRDNIMSKTTFVVGIDGSDAGERALAFAKTRAKAGDDCTIALCYVIEWSPFSFQTPEENEQRHKRREEEISLSF